MASTPNSASFQVLYTPQLIQKRKKWYDGKCNINFLANKMRSLDNEGRLSAEELWNGEHYVVPEVGSQLFFERFIVELDTSKQVKSGVKESTVNASSPARKRASFQRGEHTLGIDYMKKSSAAERKSKIPEADNTGSENEPCIYRTQMSPVKKVPQRVQLPDMGPSLDEVLPSIGRMKPVGQEFSSNTADAIPKRRKYSPWGDANSILETNDGENISTHAINAQMQIHGEEPGKVADKMQLDMTTLRVESHPSVDAHTSISSRKLDKATDHEDLFVDLDEITVPAEIGDDENNNDWDTALTIPEVYDLHSDYESDVEFVGASEASQRKSFYEDMPPDPPKEGPWTKEAYLLFSWHPPKVKREIDF